ncbi:hypothetical protein FLAG1_09138 [Fusarium langsethiae]|uniref:2EXR domain-containing protein n=1 Tax=Fusarium langsethiae TaxID=179993 RepID=A0A0M9ERC4_FUSLA|nr:hypothetical protein FLAG1_09138 [Fusarium langsethiae]
MQENFIFFNQLPLELRTKIWKFALQSASPGVHFFRLINHGQVQETGYGILLDNWPDKHSLMPPRWHVGPFAKASRNSGGSHLDGNPSSYVITLSLGRTCRESRFAVYSMEKERRKRSSVRLSATSTFVATGRNISYTFPSEPIDGSESPHIICAPEDLVVFQLHPLRLNMPSLQKYGSDAGSDKWGLGMRHIGWEYNADWFSNRETCPSTDILNFLCSCALRGARAGQLERVWIINYKIKRKQWVPSEKQANEPTMHVFDMDEYRMVVVNHKNWRHLSPEEITWDEVTDDEVPNRFLLFVNFLQGLIMLFIGHRQSPWQRRLQVGVLACERY